MTLLLINIALNSKIGLENIIMHTEIDNEIDIDLCYMVSAFKTSSLPYSSTNGVKEHLHWSLPTWLPYMVP